MWDSSDSDHSNVADWGLKATGILLPLERDLRTNCSKQLHDSWRFPKQGIDFYRIFLDFPSIFHHKPSILEYPPFMETI